jgi:hypothetical protein
LTAAALGGDFMLGRDGGTDSFIEPRNAVSDRWLCLPRCASRDHCIGEDQQFAGTGDRSIFGSAEHVAE